MSRRVTKHAPHEVRFQLYKMQWSTGNGITPLTVQFDENFKVLNPRTIAVHSSHGWGPWNSSNKCKSVLGDVWWCSTPGHGGFTIVTQTKLPDMFAPALDLTTVWLEHGGWWDRWVNWDERGFEKAVNLGGKVVPLYVYDFEEDCDWAIPMLLDSKIAFGMLDQFNPPHTLEQELQSAIESVKHSQPQAVCDFFKLVPAPNNYPIQREKDDAKRKELWAAGIPTRTSALNVDGKGVHVLFSNGEHDDKRVITGYYMSSETYNALSLMEVATPDDYRKFGELTPAPDHFVYETVHAN